MKKFYTLLLLAVGAVGFAQNAPLALFNTSGQADSLVEPDLITLSFTIDEADLPNRMDLVEREKKLVEALQNIGINTDKDLTITGMRNGTKETLIGRDQITGSKSYRLKVYDAATAANSLTLLRKLRIRHAFIERTELQHPEAVRDALIAKALEDAKRQFNAAAGAAGIQFAGFQNIQINSGRYAPVAYMARTAMVDEVMLLEAEEKDAGIVSIEPIKMEMYITVSIRMTNVD